MTINLATVLTQADELSQELGEFLADSRRSASVDMKERMARELAGYGPKSPAPRYRYVAAHHRGLFLEASESREADLPVRHLSFGDRAIVCEGLLSLRNMVGFSEALEAGVDSVKRPIHVQELPVYARGLAPNSGIKLLRGWELIPASSLIQMLHAIRDYVHGIKS